MISTTRSVVNERLVELTSKDLEPNDRGNEWLNFHKDCLAKLESENNNKLIEYTDLFVCANCKKDPIYMLFFMIGVSRRM